MDGKVKNDYGIKTRYEVDQVYWTNEITNVLKDDKVETLLRFKGLNSDSSKVTKEVSFEGIKKFDIDDQTLHAIITEFRVIKTEYELDVLKYTNRISSRAHIEVMKTVKPGIY